MSTYYVFSVNTSKGTTELAELSTWAGPGTRIPGSPAFSTMALANAWIGKHRNAPITTDVYGNKGNRWWVGLNTAVNNKTVFGTQSPVGGGEILNPAPSGYESLPSGNATDDALFAAAAAQNAGSVAKPVTISVENINWYNINGPYSTQAKANAAIAAIQKAHPAPGALQSAANALGVGGALSWEQSIANFIGNLSSANLWIRIAKVAIGGTLLIVGLAKMTGADHKIGGVAAKATKIAPFL